MIKNSLKTNKMFKKARCLLLPTKKAENCFLLYDWGRKEVSYERNYFTQSYLRNIRAKSLHLYIISDDEIAKYDWVYNPLYKTIYQWIENADIKFDRIDAKKIIATTDSSLNLPQPSQSFIEKYIEQYNKGFRIEEVLVEYEEYTETNYSLGIDSSMPMSRLKVDKNNTITIKKIKDSWSREEVIELCKDATINGVNIRDRNKVFNDEFDKWIEENL